MLSHLRTTDQRFVKNSMREGALASHEGDRFRRPGAGGSPRFRAGRGP
jgi:hypothetical protein